jgi:cobalt-zinc-cadmium efflux system membrane fusion protein
MIGTGYLKRALPLLLLLACAKKEEKEKDPRPPAGEVWLSRQQIDAQEMRLTTVGEEMVETHLDAPGKISFDDLLVAHAFSPASGRIVKIDAEPGQHVQKGAPLVELQSPEAGSAFADVEKAAADVAVARRELKRERELIAAQAGAQKDLDQAESAYDRARAELVRAKQRASNFRESGADVITERFILRSPIDGEVIARNANFGTEIQGQYAGGIAPELFTIGSVDRVWVYADVFEIDLPRVKVGAEVKVKVVAYPDRSFEGRVEWVSSVLDPASRSARVRCTLPNPQRELSPEMYATVSISTPPRKSLAVPRSAVLHTGDERIAFVQSGTTENGLLKFQRRRLQVEETDGDLVPVKGGLLAGDRVMVSGAILLSGIL